MKCMRFSSIFFQWFFLCHWFFDCDWKSDKLRYLLSFTRLKENSIDLIPNTRMLFVGSSIQMVGFPWSLKAQIFFWSKKKQWQFRALELRMTVFRVRVCIEILEYASNDQQICDLEHNNIFFNIFFLKLIDATVRL